MSLAHRVETRRRRPALVVRALLLGAALSAAAVACEEHSQPPPRQPQLDTPSSSLGAARRSAEDLQERIAEHQRKVIEQIEQTGQQ